MITEKRTKTLLIGVDGADPKIIFNLAQRGILENFQNLIRSGSYGILRSTIHANTVPAWTSSVTGVNSGKHGLYDIFLSVDLKSKKIEYANSTKRKTKAIWNILSSLGKKVIILNVPATYPPEKVNGIIVSGMFTPSLKSQFTYPSSIKDELLELGYQIDIGGTLIDILLTRARGKKMRMLSLITELIRKRTMTAKYLMKEFEWDLFLVVFVGLDRLQHWYWNLIDPSHITYNKNEAIKIHDNIINVYKFLDKSIGELLDIYKQKNVIIYSDHGFRPVNKFFFTNNFLKNKKILEIKEQNKINSFIGQEDIFRFIEKLHLENLVNCFPNYLKRKMGILIKPSNSFLDVFQIELNNTKAYQFSNFIRINDEIMNSKEREKTINYIRDTIYKLNYGIKVYESKKVFKGPETKNIPQLTLSPEKDVTPSQFLPINGVLEKEYDPTLRIPMLMRSGDHSPWGIFIMNGPYIKSIDEVYNENIMFIAPTALHLLKQNIPTYMDGNISRSVKF